MYSLKNRLTRSLIVNMVVIMLLLLLGLNWMIERLVKDHVLTRLQHDAESLISLVNPLQDGHWELNPAHMSTIYNRVRSGHYYVVKTPQQEFRSRSLFDFDPRFSDLAEGEQLTFQMPGPGDESWLVWQQQFYRDAIPLQVWVSEDITPLYKDLYRFSGYAVLMVVVVTALSIYLQQRILNKAFHVFERLRHNLQAIRHRESGVPDSNVPQEVLPLVREIELLVEQLGLRIQRTRSAIANLSHEIKRPLQLLSLHFQSGDKDATASAALADIEGIVERELRRAKVSGSSAVGGVFRPANEIPYLVQVMNRIYPDRAVDMDLQDGLDVINLDRDDMLELIGNLLDNACKFARQAVRVQIQQQDSLLLFTFEDDGPGVDAEVVTDITQKGARLDESVQGHGLGLGICADIVASYHGQLAFARSGMGGLKVSVSIPVA